MNIESREWNISAITILKLIAAMVLFYFAYLLREFFMLFFISVLLAVAFQPLVDRIAKRTGRPWAVAIVALVTGALFILIGLIVVPVMIEQITALINELPKLKDSIGSKFPIFKHANPDPKAAEPVITNLAKAGGMALEAASGLVLVYVFMLYLLFDGKRTYAWLIAFFNPETRKKIAETCEGVSPVISAYIIGQIITSVLCTLFSFGILSAFHVPSAVMLAVIAGIFDILPVIGFFLFAIPAALFALTVSPSAAALVFALFLAYHLLEAYFISPLIYGNRLRVSGFVVLLSLVVGATVGGILGAIAILPVVASYPVIEKIWLKKYLGSEVIAKHETV